MQMLHSVINKVSKVSATVFCAAEWFVSLPLAVSNRIADSSCALLFLYINI